MENDLVSIIMPSFNSAKFIAESIESVLGQSYKNWELIITDDCSTDNSVEIIKNYLKMDKRIVLSVLDHNCGAAVARNNSIDLSRGRFIAFLDSDDIWLPDKLSVQLKFFETHKEVSLVYSDYYVMRQKGRDLSFCPRGDSCSFRKLLYKCDIGCLTAIYDSGKLGKVYMPVTAKKREDYATWLKITKTGCKAFHCHFFVAKYRLTDKSVSRKKIALIRYQYNVYRTVCELPSIVSAFYVVAFALHKLFFKYW